tara:strand:- start:75 stop:935 length:861 start_codon:yes stop_codon:yes gene_type:complete
MKNVALLISGGVRTFVINEQFYSFSKLIDYLNKYTNLDIYIYIKIQESHKSTHDLKYILSEKGLINLDRILKLLKPKCLKWDYNKYKDEDKYKDQCKSNWMHNYYSQIGQLNELLEECDKNKEYDFYLRCRPDIGIKYFDVNFDLLKEDTIYTSTKKDCPGNDQFYIFSHKIYMDWWKKYVLRSMGIHHRVPPEYILFEGDKHNSEFINYNNYDYNKFSIVQLDNIIVYLIRDYFCIKDWGQRCNIKINENFWKYHDKDEAIKIKILIGDHDIWYTKFINIIKNYT